jgi:hypothetical protein
MKFSYNKSKKLLTNKYFLYFVLILSCLYLLFLLLEKRFNLVIVFGLIAYIIYCFNKNMIVVLGVSLIITFISTLGMKVKEGLENNTTPPTVPPPEKKKSESIVPPNLTNGSVSTTTTDSTATTPEAKNTTTESMNSISRKRGRIDENAASVQDTYNDLNKLLENGAGPNLNIDTKQLLEQQAQLTEAMKNMGPLIESAKTLMNGMNFEGLNNLASSLVSKN